MKRNDIKALKDKSVAELQKQLAQLVVELARKRHEKKVGKIVNSRSVSVMSDDIARIKTILKEKELVG
ncbi:MAG TPA: 50S ribosomal protein L29 [Vitreimonas sp.]|nr:50S ribosomal protein L29 [Vitreimonas sp.]